jgi:N-acetylmuramoyl-L-alanine amidase
MPENQAMSHLNLKLSPMSLCLAAAFLALTLTPSAHASTLHVMIDPGHGGVDVGAARGNIKESEIALKVSLLLADMLKSDARFRVSMTRTKDAYVSLGDRTRMAKDLNADVFVSIHVNSSQDPRARGKEFYFQNQLPADEEALFLASRENLESDSAEEAAANNQVEALSSNSDLKRILEDLNRNYRIVSSSQLSKKLLESWTSLGPPQRGSRAIRQAPFRVVSDINIPSVLVELGFLTHPQERQRLVDSDYQKTLAKSLHDGLIQFKETMDKNR